MSVSTNQVGQSGSVAPAGYSPPEERRRLGEWFMLWLLMGTMVMLAVMLVGDLARGLFR